MANIKDALVELNPWWKKEFRAEFKKREILSKIKKFLKQPQIIALTGLRRVGKTTLMLKIAEDYINSGFDAKKIVFFSFDSFREKSLREVIKAYEELMEQNIEQGKTILFLDEIQKAKNWDEQAKSLYDSFKNKVKIIVSGSESLFIKNKARETLAGRIFEFRIEQLSFNEFLSFKKQKAEPKNLYRKELQKALEEFISIQGFPELVGVKDKEIIEKYIKESIVERVIYRDMVKLFNIRDISSIETILNTLMDEPGQIIEISKLAKELGISRQSTSNYLEYLKESFLIRKLYNYSKNKRKTERKLKKYYPTIISPSLTFKKDNISKSKAFEWMIVSQLKAEFFWRDPYKNEVDIIQPEQHAIEIKYGKIKTTGIQAFMKKFNQKKATIITKETEKTIKTKQGTIKLIPAWKYLLKENSKK